MDMKEKFMQSFKHLGFVLEPLDEEKTAYFYNYEGHRFIYFVNDNDPIFVSIGIPAIIEISEEQRPYINKWIQLFNSNIKYVKGYIFEGGVWLFYERMITETENTDESLAHMIIQLENSMNTFQSYVEDALGDDDDEDDDDEEEDDDEEDDDEDYEHYDDEHHDDDDDDASLTEADDTSYDKCPDYETDNDDTDNKTHN